MHIHISGARIIDPASGLDRVTELYLQNGKIAALGHMPSDFNGDLRIDGRGLIAAPGLVDLAASLREPGLTRKGTIASETRAAAAGGVTSLCCTPDSQPVADSSAVVDLILDRAREAGNAKVFPIGALSQGLQGERLAELMALKESGCVAFSAGLNGFANNRLLLHALEYAATFDLTVIFRPQDSALAAGGLAHQGKTASFLGLAGIPESAETVALARDLLLVEQSGVRAHFSGLSCARSARMIGEAKARGLPVTADVALYQLLLTDEALADFSSLYHVMPPLRSDADRLGLLEAVKSGVIDGVASHHQPHEADAKNAPFASTEPGISSIELLLPLALSLVQDGLLDVSTLLARLTCGPATALRLPAGKIAVGCSADLVLFNPQQDICAGKLWYSQGRNCPFIGQTLRGALRYTLLDGHIVHQTQQ